MNIRNRQRFASTKRWAPSTALFFSLVLLSGIAGAGEAEDSEWEARRSFTVSAGVDYSKGDYGEESDTQILSAPLTLKLEWEPVILKVTVPFLLIRGTGAVVGGSDGGVIVGDDVGPLQTDTGIGDVVASATYVFYPESGLLPVLEFTGKAKFATADEDKGLGTGENDYTLQIDASKAFGPITPFASFGYRFVGDPPGSPLDDPPGSDLDDILLASGGLGIKLMDGLSIGAVYDWRQAASARGGDSHELVPYASLKLGKRLSLNPYAVIGLSQGAADFGAGFQLSLRFGGR